MAELILTEEELAADTWLELDDATIGKLVKHTALQLKDTPNRSAEQAALWWWAAAIMMVGATADTNADTFTQTIKGYSRHGQIVGDFKITVEKLPEAGASALLRGPEVVDQAQGESIVVRSDGEPHRPLASSLLDSAVRERLIHSGDKDAASQAHRIVESALPEAVQFLFRRMRLFGIVPTFYAGDALYSATGAPTSGNGPDKALKTLAEDLVEQWGLAADSATGIVKGVARHLIDVDRLPESVALTLAKDISQGDVIALSAYQAM